MMKIVFDNIVFGLQRAGGISVVWQELLQYLQNKGLQDMQFIDVDNDKVDNYNRKKLKIAEDHQVDIIQHPKLVRYLPVRTRSDSPFIFHSSYYRYCTHPNAINVTTVHDFTYELFVKGIKQKMHTWQKFSAIRHSAAVACISENTKRDLLRLMPDVDERKVTVIYNGVSEVYQILDKDSRECHLPFPSKSYVVFIGRRDDYKNFGLTVKGVAATDLNLLIVGSQLNEEEKRMVEEYLPPTRYKCLGHVFDAALNAFYNYAAALVYPSSYEGFGLPVLEAQRAGCPVIAYHASSIPEVIGNTPLLMNELSEEELVRKLRLLSDSDMMKQVRADGLANSRRFSWEAMGNGYLKLNQQLWSAARKA